MGGHFQELWWGGNAPPKVFRKFGVSRLKRLPGLVAALALVVTGVSFWGVESAHAAPTDWGDSSWELVDGDEPGEYTLEIGPGQLPDTDYGSRPWMSEVDLSDITKVVFTDPGNTSFGESATDFFAAMDSLRTIEGIGEVDTSQVEDMSYMFA